MYGFGAIRSVRANGFGAIERQCLGVHELEMYEPLATQTADFNFAVCCRPTMSAIADRLLVLSHM